MMTRASVGVGVVLLAGCVADEPGAGAPAAAFTVSHDSAGVQVVQSSARTLETVLPWRVHPEPDLVLGREDTADGPAFFRIGGMVALPDGGVVVVDGESRELRWFDGSGAWVRTRGGPGGGPGEFSSDPLLVPQFARDSLLLFDRTARRLTWMAMDGSGVRVVTSGEVAVDELSGLPRMAHGTRVLFAGSSGSGSCQPNERCELPMDLRWVDVLEATVDTLDVSHVMRLIDWRMESGGRVFLDGPLDPGALAAPGPTGPVVEGSAPFELRVFDVDGDLVSVLRVDAPPLVEPREALETWLQGSPEADELRPILERLLPEVVPGFQRLLVDPEGWRWAELFEPGEGAGLRWLVLDPDGAAHGVMELPQGLEVHEIGMDFVLGRWVDDLGREEVRRYPLQRDR